MTKTVIWVVVAIVVIAGGWFLWSKMSGSPSAADTNQAPVTTTQGSEQTPAPNDNSSDSSNLSNGNSDADLNSDMNQIDSSVNASASASGDAQTSSDQPVQQSY